MARPDATLGPIAWLQAARSDPRLDEAFFPRVTDEEEAAIATLLDSVVSDAQEWCDGWTLFNRGPILPLALLNCVHFPHLSSAQVGLQVRSSLWIYALDDHIDDGDIADGELEDLLAECLDVARFGRVRSGMHDLPMSLSRLRDDLSEQPLWDAVFPAWVTSLTLLVDGMMREHAARQQLHNDGCLVTPLSVDDYLSFAAHSIGLPHQWVAGLAMEPDACIRDDLASLVALAEQCGMAMRLANDSATWDREESEGGVNAVRLERWSYDPAVSPRLALLLARRRVHNRMGRELQACRDLAASIRGSSSVANRFVRATEFGVDLYARHDLRTWAGSLARALRLGTTCS